MFKEGWCAGLKQEGGSLREGGGIVWNTIKGYGTEKWGVERNLKKKGGGQAELKDWCFKKGEAAGTPLRIMNRYLDIERDKITKLRSWICSKLNFFMKEVLII